MGRPWVSELTVWPETSVRQTADGGVWRPRRAASIVAFRSAKERPDYRLFRSEREPFRGAKGDNGPTVGVRAYGVA